MSLNLFYNLQENPLYLLMVKDAQSIFSSTLCKLTTHLFLFCETSEILIGLPILNKPIYKWNLD